MIRALAILIALSGPAAAQTVPKKAVLKASVTVTSEVVRIGDLIENAGVVSDVPVFRAPDLGTTGAVSTESVIDAIRPHELIGIDTQGLSQVVVTRASRTIASPEIEARVAQVLAGQSGLGAARNLSVRFDRNVRTFLQVEPNAIDELKPLHVSYDPRNVRFDITFDLPGSDLLHGQPLRATGIVFETVEAVMVNRPVERGEILKAGDLTTERRPKAEMTGNVVADAGGAVGLAAKRELRPGQPLRDADLMKPEIVQRNESVTILYQAPGIVLSIRGKAQESGALGDLVSVLNVQSKRVVQGTVSGPGRVIITPATTRVVDMAPPDAAVAAAGQGQRAE